MGEQRLKGIKVSGLKCLEGTFEFSPITVIVGDNGVGKTALVNAVELLATNQLAAIGKATDRIFALATDGKDNMLIDGEFGDLRIKRDWERFINKDGKPSIKAGLQFTGMSSDVRTKASKAQSELESKFRPSTFGIDIRWFSGLATTDRRKVVMDMLMNSGVFVKRDMSLPEWLFTLASELEHEEGDLDVVEKLIEEFCKEADDFGTPLDQIRIVKDAVRKALTQESRDLESVQGTLKNLGIEEAVTVDTSRIDDLKKAIEKTQKSIGVKNNEIGSGRANKDNRERVQRKITEKSEALKHERYLNLGDLNLVEPQLVKANKEKDDQQKLCDTDAEQIRNIDAELKASNNALAKLGERKTWAEGLAGNETASCYLCGSDIEPKEILKMIMAEIEEIESEISILNELRGKKEKELEALLSTKTGIEKRITGIINLRTELRAKVTLEVNIGKLEAERDEFVIPDMEMLAKELEALTGTKDENASELEDLIKSEAQAKTFAKAELEKTQRERKVRCLKQIKKASGNEGIEGTLIRENIEPFVKTVNAILSDFGDKEFYIHFEDGRGKETCDFGYSENGISRKWESASGGEQLLIALAMGIALSRMDGSATARFLLIDEIQDLDMKNFTALIKTVKAAIRKDSIDNVFLAGVVSGPQLTMLLDEQGEEDSIIKCLEL